MFQGGQCHSRAELINDSAFRHLQDKVEKHERHQRLLPRPSERECTTIEASHPHVDDAVNQRADVSEIQPAELPSNPLVPDQPNYMRDSEGQLRYLGHSSTFSFSRQVLQMLRDHEVFSQQHTPIHWDAESYLNFDCALLPLPDFADLPSLEVSLLNLHIVKFRTTPLYYLFNEITFTESLNQFYKNLAVGLQPSRTWYVQYLLVMALGKAFNPPRGNSRMSGMDLFNRALQLLPDVTVLYREPLLAIEILCCIALYLYSIDHRSAGYINVRMCISRSIFTLTCIDGQSLKTCTGRRSSYKSTGRLFWIFSSHPTSSSMVDSLYS